MRRELSVQDFRNDFSHLVVRYGEDKTKLKQEAKLLIEQHYSTNSQLRRACLDWLKERMK